MQRAPKAEARRAVELDPLSIGVRGGRGSILLVARRYDEAVKQLETRCKVQVRNLPPSGDRLGKPGAAAISPPGLLYLENRYVVPGGRFNEMYGWDSYFIIVGLLRDGRLDLAQDMVNNFLFEVEHYGAVLNANRTYYLTRSQPPFLTSMIL